MALARGAGRTLSRDTLLEEIAGRQADAFDRTIDIYVGRLRRKIEADPRQPRLIVTVPGVGYRLTVRPLWACAPEKPASGPSQAEGARPRAAERRHLTVLMCALAEAPALAARLDPEELAPLLAAWRDTCSGIVARCGGLVAKVEGDRLTAWFGYPEASEHHVERAIRAGLAIVADIPPFGAALGSPVHGQVAVATGMVLAGDLEGASKDAPAAFVGEALIAAASLLSRTPPGAVVIAEATRDLVGRLFALRDVEGAQNGTGRAYEVLGEAGVEDRFAALRGMQTPLVGRDEDLSLLLRRWRQARSGAGSAVLIAGEPGIGKSRLVRELHLRLDAPSPATISCFCSPHHRDSAYFPIIRYLEHAAGVQRSDTGEMRRAKLEALLRTTETPADEMHLLADLIAPVANADPSRDPASRSRRERLHDALVGRAVALARRRPLLIVFEDVHWIDPTSLEILDTLVERIADLPALLLITFRPEFIPPWTGRPRVSSIVLNALDDDDTAELVEHVVGEAIDAKLSRAIVERAGGIPLCVEELGRIALEGDGTSLPASLRDTLSARLERLPAARAAAQLGAVIGRSFDRALVSAIADETVADLDGGLDALVASGLAARRGVGADAAFTFKHVLVQEAAYDSLPRSRRATIHARIVEALIAQDPTIADRQPDVLAHHCKYAGDSEMAVTHLIRAGWLSQYRAAYREADEQFHEALRLIAALPQGEARDRAEMRARRGIGLTIGNSAGYASSQFGANTARAAELCERLGYPPEFAGIGYGLYVFHLNRSELARAMAAGERLSSWGRSKNDIRGRVLGRQCIGSVMMQQGDFAAARSHLEQALDLYQSSLADPTLDWTYRTGMSGSRLCGNTHNRLAEVCCWMGYPDQAMAHLSAANRYGEREIVVIARIIDRWWRLFTTSFLGEPSELVVPAEKLVAHSRENGLPLFVAYGTIMRGCAIARCGDPEAGRTVIGEGLAAHAATEAVMHSCYFRAMLAETHQMLGERDAALALLNEALMSVEQTGEKWCLAELHRRIGEVRRQLGDHDAATQSFEQALAVSRRQGARLWELRAATSVARMLRDAGDGTQAEAVLAPVYDWFGEGFDTVPLREARALLDALGRSHPDGGSPLTLPSAPTPLVV